MPSNEKTALLLRNETKHAKFTLVIHGGAGTMDKSWSTPELRAQYKAALSQALLAGYAVLSSGGEAMDAAVAAVSSMEDCPLFNSGKGAVFNVAGKNELETSLMLSRPPSTHPSIPPTRRGVGITLLTHARNPSKLARALYLSPTTAPHTMFSGTAAEALGETLGVELVDESYFFTEQRWREHRRGLGLPDEPIPYPSKPGHSGEDNSQVPLDQLPTGTVGAVALDVREGYQFRVASDTCVCVEFGRRCSCVIGSIGGDRLHA
ncbi:nucleophile aminohydrolase [Fomes fomentarius]|nr:nucleophile aminohydrolase [Fomes fomentarius]